MFCTLLNAPVFDRVETRKPKATDFKLCSAEQSPQSGEYDFGEYAKRTYRYRNDSPLSLASAYLPKKLPFQYFSRYNLLPPSSRRIGVVLSNRGYQSRSQGALYSALFFDSVEYAKRTPQSGECLRRKREPSVERSSTTGNTTLSNKDGVAQAFGRIRRSRKCKA